MHTKTHLKAALHQLSLARAEMQGLGYRDLSHEISETEAQVVLLIRQYYALSQPSAREAV